MKKIVLFFLLSIPLLGYAQEHHVGIRIGEPLALTYRTFLNEQFSLEGLVGRAGANSGQYYRRVFENNRPHPGAFYGSHSAAGGLSLNARGAYNEDISSEFDITQGTLLAYGGAGVQLRTVKVDYVYYNDMGSAPIPQYEKRTNVDFGAEGFIGSEYYFDNLPMTVFAEVGLFLEILDRPGHVRLQGGIGARYLF